MSAVQDAIRQRQRGLRRLMRWPWAWPLLAMPLSLIVYVLAVIAADLALIGWELAATRWLAGDLALAAALLVAAVICIEAIRRLGQPSGVSRDLLSAWWLPIALLLPPIYALIAPFVVGMALYMRGRRATPIYRRVFSSAALGLAGAATSVTFHRIWPDAAHVSLGGAPGWLSRPVVLLTAVGCAVLFGVVNTGIVAIAAHLAEPGAPLGEVLWDKESLLLDLTETCIGILVAITCALSPLLLVVALPPVILLQRSLMHQQLQAAARTDAKTGLLNAAAWQREADAEVSRALRSGTLRSGTVGSGTLGSGTLGSGTLGSGILGSGILGSGVLGSGVLGSGARGSGARGSGILGSGILGSETVGPGVLGAAALEAARLEPAARPGGPLAMLLIDVDHFKRVNDSHGHLVGDEVLRSLASELRQQVRESDIVGRFGGEEFTVLLPRADAAEALHIAERLRRSASALTIFAGDIRIGVTVSIGVAVLGQHGRDLFELLAAADLALYRAKDKGRNQVCLYGGDEATDAGP